MFENADTNSSPSQNDNYDGSSSADYLLRAAQACQAGDAVLGTHLYLAAFEKGSQGAYPDDAAVDGLRQAWSLACTLKERSLAEYIFEKLEPFLPADEVAACAQQLQRLALDKLEEFGLTREDLEDMTDMISQDFLGIESGLVKVEHVTLPGGSRSQSAAKKASAQPAVSRELPQEKVASKEPENTPSSAAITNQGTSAVSLPGQPDTLEVSATNLIEQSDSNADAHATMSVLERITYADIVGYENTVALMRNFGLGMHNDPQFQSLVTMLNARHGLESMPAADALLFRSPAREDANRFMLATLGELNLPSIRMRMEESLQGLPVLCVMAQADNQPRLNAGRNAFEGPGVLVLEDLDLWISPLNEIGDELGGFMFASLSRGAREAINLIRSAAENPEVYVLASSAEMAEVDPFFLDLLEPLSMVDIDFPTESERGDIWGEIAQEHPSLRDIDRERLVRFSAGMPRFDLYMAAREAIEEAYKASLVARCYVPVTTETLFEKLAAYQPLDSEEYRALEDAVVDDFKRELEHLDDLLKESGE